VVSPDAISVVHLNGQLDELPAQVSAMRVLQNHPHHFICCSRDLFAVNCRPLQPEEDLRLGELYFLLPLSVIESDSSAQNLVALAARLYAAAKKELSRAAQRRRSTNSTCDLSRAAQRRRSSNSTCDLSGDGRSSMYEKFLRSCDEPEVKIAFREQLIPKSRSWRPRLHTIQEISLAY